MPIEKATPTIAVFGTGYWGKYLGRNFSKGKSRWWWATTRWRCSTIRCPGTKSLGLIPIVSPGIAACPWRGSASGIDRAQRLPTRFYRDRGSHQSGVGASPVFVDIGPRTFNIDPALLETEVARIEAERTSRQVFSLPMHPYLSDDEIDGIVNVITHAVS